ncbi:GNAT family N-acetyltransferase [Rossellomorea marisflavi]|uniref:GNAT family N-acetyltransferase n=1 Tax=Rossellomorea marisflavi TaxID=189381 RepID=UPI002557ED5A|nr:GNAT family N-acetyltransferase [Rossellomorea marisflavi]
MNVVPVKEIEVKERVGFFHRHWGGTEMVISTGIHDCVNLDGFACLEDNKILGLITFVYGNQECEIISLDSLREGVGIGSFLLRRVEEEAVINGCLSLSVITTNDNLNALGFYQRRGFQLIDLKCNAVETARIHKPSIPYIAENGIPIRDEILLNKQL